MPTDTALWNKLDILTRNVSHAETDGVLIGPHASNLLSEMILLQVDKELIKKQWICIRYIDDYKCFVNNEKEADEFIVSLRSELNKYNLDINHKKTKYIRLPNTTEEAWITDIKKTAHSFLGNKNKYTTYSDIQNYLNSLWAIYKENKNQAILYYGLTIINHSNLSSNAIDHLINILLNWSLHFPYLVPNLDKLLLQKYHKFISKDTWEKYINFLFNNGIATLNFEEIIYSIYFLKKYNKIILDTDDIFVFTSDIFMKTISKEKLLNLIENIENPVLNVILYDYLFNLNTKKTFNKKSVEEEILTLLIETAKKQVNCIQQFEENWLFAYEVLDLDFLTKNLKCTNNNCSSKCKERIPLMGLWKELKKNNISFLKSKTQNGIEI